MSTAVNKTGRGAARGPELIEPIDARGDQSLHLVPAPGLSKPNSA